MKVKTERTEWRDRAMSARHRRYGWNCPAIDIDFLEINEGEPVAIIELKHERARKWDLNSKPAQAFIALANRAELPALYVTRAEDFSWWQVQALNTHAEKYLGEEFRRLSEPEFVSLLYALRGLNLPPETAARTYCREHTDA